MRERTHNCGALRKEHVQERVSLFGWVHRRRNLGAFLFFDLRDLYGKTQLFLDPQKFPALQEIIDKVRLEWVVHIEGTVRERSSPNKLLATGEVEVEVDSFRILSSAKTPPFTLFGNDAVHEDLRLQYRFLEIRKGAIAKNLLLRHQAMLHIRNHLSHGGFFEITTPILGKTTPEGARDYLVPSRVHPQNFYALPQSPQLFKQMLMISGMDRYFQIAPCFRDEDLRRDRQPEFTQVDIEISFSHQEAFFAQIESLMSSLFQEVEGTEIPTPFPRMSHEQCLNLYGTDKPDTRFGMQFIDLTEIVEKLEAPPLRPFFKMDALAKGIVLPKGAKKSRKELSAYIEAVQKWGLPQLTWIKRKEGLLSSNATKLFGAPALEQCANALGMQEGDLALFGIAPKKILYPALDRLRRRLGEEEGLQDPKKRSFLWVTDFPLFTKEDAGGLASAHHPFTAPHPDDLPLLKTHPTEVRSLAYDLVLNGYELGSGSERIHQIELQEEIFSLLGMPGEEIEEKFGFFLRALSYGTPPHMGIALGLDRIMMVLCEADNIREVIAFPKTQNASDLLLQAPSSADKAHLQELGIKL
ncbi:MAG: aspartate--tRNA ligase [Chlamydiota bacterium]